MTTILFNSPKAVMVRLPKTGSTSVVRGIFGGIENAADKKFGTFPESWHPYYSFTFVRNPFDRLVSAFLMFKNYPTQNKEEKIFQEGLDIFTVFQIIEDPRINISGDSYLEKLKKHTVPMTSEFFFIDKVKNIFRFENYESEYLKLCGELSFPLKNIPHFRKTSRSHYRDYYSREERELAKIIFKEDCLFFNYNF